MTGKRGRPPDSEDERWRRAQTARRTVDEELAAMQREGPIKSLGKANDRAARRLGISMKTLKRLLAVDPRNEPPPKYTWDEWQQIQRDDWEVDNQD